MYTLKTAKGGNLMHHQLLDEMAVWGSRETFPKFWLVLHRHWYVTRRDKH